MVRPRIGEIRNARIRNGLSARALASRAGIHFSTAALLEKEGHNVAPATAKAVSDALGVPFDSLFDIIEREEAQYAQQ